MKWRQKSGSPAKPRAKPRPAKPARPEPQPAREEAQAREPERPARPKARPARENGRTRENGRDRQDGQARDRKPKLSRLHKPAGMSLEDWQIELRRQFGREQDYRLKNLGEDTLFSEFEVTNPQSGGAYRVQIRGRRPGDNFCTCPDFATNTLGTCKHIEFTLASLERKRGAVARLKAGFQPTYSEVFLHYGLRREVRFRPGTSCPVELARLSAQYFGPDGALLPEAFAAFDDFLAEAARHDPELRCSEDALGLIAEVRDAEGRRQRVAEAFPKGIRSAALKDLVAVELYDYQKEGALFAARTGRCLIGDEMGLGKTVESLAAAEIMAKLFAVERVLVVCPTSLKHQWQREIERLVKHRTVQVIGGLRNRREKGFATSTFFKVMNYDTVHSDLDLIGQWAPDLVILDEAQRIKNWSTRVARSVKRISSPHTIVLTGTPLENRLEELISIVQFVDRFRLGPTFRLLHQHQVHDEHGKVVGYRNLDQIGQTLEPILLRRQKDQVLDQLPERIETNIFVPMTERQRTYHTENLEIVARIVERWRRLRYLPEADQRRLMIALQRMRMACDNSYLVDHHSDHGPKADEAVTLLEEHFERPGTKVVVFSQWLRMHELLVRRFKKKGWGHVLFHGGVPSGKRKDLVDRFRDDPHCQLFLSTDAGGVGLNLQHATVVLNMDLPWNPAVLEQRIGRVHRLGQEQPVRVAHFISQGTIEEGMQQVLKFKKSLFAGVLDGGEKEVFLGGSRLNRFMEQVEAAAAAIPEEMIEDAEEALRAPPGELAGPDAAGAAGTGRRRGGRGQAAAAAAGGRGLSVLPMGMEPDDEAGGDGAAAADPWAGLLQVGMALWQQFTAGSQNGGAAGAAGPLAAGALKSLVKRDESTGESYLKLPVPSTEVIDKALRAIGGLLESLKR
jgi:superfamily II DNA or RNA helicase